MKKLWRYMRPYRRDCILSPLFKLLEAAQELLVPLVMAAVIDRGIGGGDRGYIIRMCLLLVGMGMVGLLLAVTAQYFAARAATGFVARLRQAVFDHIQALSHRTLDEIGTPTLITRLTGDMNQVQNGVNLSLRLLLRSPLIVFGSMVMAFLLDTRAALIFAAVIPVLAAVVFAILLPGVPLYRKVQEKTDNILGRTRENLTGVRVIRAFRREENEIAAFDGDNAALTRAQNRAGRVSALLNPLTYAIINAALLILVYTGALRVDGGYLTQGTVIALYNYMAQILVELIKFANLILNIIRSVACAGRIRAVLELPDAPGGATVPAAPGKAVPRVALRDVTLCYHPGAAPAIAHITLEAQAGETVGIIGGTSAGKSSLLRLIPRFYDATDGTVLVDGTDVRQWDTAALRRRIGVVPQTPVLFRGTVRDNLLRGKEDAADADLWEALEAAQAKAFVSELPGGLDYAIEQGGRNLSGGQRQRLTVARALVRRPDILLLDDAAAALDYGTEAALRRALRTLSWKPTVLLVSQRIGSVRHADRIAVLEDGRLVGWGEHDTLLRDCAVYREICASQSPRETEVSRHEG